MFGKESACQCRRHKRCIFSPWVGKIPWSKKWQPTVVFLPGKFHGQSSQAGYSPQGHKESDTNEQTERTHTHTHTHTHVSSCLFFLLWVCCCAQTYCYDFPCCRAQALGTQALVIAARGLSSWSLPALECGLSTCGTQTQLLRGMWNLHVPEIKSTSPALTGEFLCTVPLGKSYLCVFKQRESTTRKGSIERIGPLNNSTRLETRWFGLE